MRASPRRVRVARTTDVERSTNVSGVRIGDAPHGERSDRTSRPKGTLGQAITQKEANDIMLEAVLRRYENKKSGKN
jgi:hypothetical protein